MTNTFSPSQLGQALPLAIKKMNPKSLINVPVMFLVEVGAAFTFILAIAHPSLFTWSITVWLWLTVLFATLAEAVAEGRGKAQADSLRASRTETTAVKFTSDAAPGNLQKALEGPEGRNGHTEDIAGDALTPGDIVLVTAGEIIPADGDVIFGAATVDESAVTGESAPVIRESGGDRSAVTGGTRVLSDGGLQRRRAIPRGARGTACVSDSDDHWRAAVRHWYRWYGPPRAAQRAGNVWSRG